MRAIHARNLWLGFFLALTIMVLVGARYAPSEASPPGVTAEQREAAVALRECIVRCLATVCGAMPWEEHQAPDDGEWDLLEPDEGPHPDECDPPTCDWWSGSGHHPTCLNRLQLTRSGDYDRLRRALQSGDDRTVQGLVRRHPQALIVNAKRRSVQVIGCDGSAVANHPLDAALFERLTADQ